MGSFVFFCCACRCRVLEAWFEQERIMASKNLDILVVDDQEPVRVLLSRILENLGFSHDLAINGRDCLAKLHAKNYHVIILDLILPDIDGKTLLHHMRLNFPQAQVIICSSLDDQDLIEQHLAMGASAFIVKPFDADEIKSVIASLHNDGPEDLNQNPAIV